MLGSAALALLSPALYAQGGAVRIVVGFPPAGGADAMARLISQRLATLWNVPVVVENRPGDAGAAAAEYVSKSASDGSVLMLAHINSHALAPAMGARLGYDAARDFAPIGLVAVTPHLLIGNAQQPARSVKELVALCKSRPGKVRFASAGVGSSQHFSFELFKQQAGVSAVHVPYAGAGPALQDLVAGKVDYCFETMTAATPYIRDGRVVALGQTRLRRATMHPNVPTMAEEGFPFEATVWYGLAAPAALVATQTQRINRDLNKILALPDVQESLTQVGAEDGGGSPEKFAEFMQQERAKWTKLARAAGLKAVV